MAGLARRGGSMQDRFGRELLDRFRASPAVAESWYSASRFAIGYRRRQGGAACWAYLGNLYAECAGLAGGFRDDRLARFVAAMAEPVCVPSDWPAAAPLLRPLLCGASFARGVPGRSVRPEADLVRRPALPMLDELVVVDLPHSFGYVSRALAADWGVPHAEIYAAARRNLAGDGRSVEDPTASTTEPALLRFVDDGDAYWVPRLLTDGWLVRLGRRLGGRPVAFAPDRDGLLVVREGPALAGIFDVVAAEYAESVHPVSPMGYTVDGAGRLVPYRVPPGHPLHPAVRRARRQLAGTEYDAQADLLRSGPGAVSVASYLLADAPDGSTTSVATWSEDAPTLLPVTDRVAMVSADRRQSWLVRWEALISGVRARPVPGLVPPRYRVGPWPRGAARDTLLAGADHRPDGADG